MWGRLVTKLVVRMLKSARIGNEERQILTSTLLDRLGALPLRARMVVDEAGRIFVNGKELDMDMSKKLYESSKSMLNNFARRFVREQVTYMAIHDGVHKNSSPEQGLFAKAALWNFQEEDELYRKFAQNEAEEDGQ